MGFAKKQPEFQEPLKENTAPDKSNAGVTALVAFSYLGLTLFLDAATFLHWMPKWLAAPFQYTWGSFYVFPQVLWLGIPLAFSFRSLEKGLFTFERWKKSDKLLILTVCIAFALSLPLIKIYPQFTQFYVSKLSLSSNEKWLFLLDRFLFTMSWLPAWEFAHRGFLLPLAARAFPRFGWWLVPLCETGYHLIKPMPEMIGMFFFSIISTLWVMKRRNLLLPFVAHFLIEFLLYVYLVLY